MSGDKPKPNKKRKMPSAGRSKKGAALKAASAIGRDPSTGKFKPTSNRARRSVQQVLKPSAQVETVRNTVKKMETAIDAIESLAYQEGVKGVIKMDEFDYMKEIIAKRYGVPVGKITPEFLKAKRLARQSDNDEYYEEMERKYGIKFEKFEPRCIKNTP